MAYDDTRAPAWTPARTQGPAMIGLHGWHYVVGLAVLIGVGLASRAIRNRRDR